MTTQRPPGHTRRHILTFLFVGSAVLFVLVAGAAAATRLLTVGPIPDGAFQPGGPLVSSLVPDFVPASDQNGEIVGYVPKAYIVDGLADPTDSLGRPQSPNIPVFAADLKTLVGYMVPDKGFVPLGTSPESVPTIPVQQGPPGITPP
jgi:hypothetical protein